MQSLHWTLIAFWLGSLSISEEIVRLKHEPEFSLGCLQVQALEERMTAKIMKEARAQNQDLEAEDNVMLQSSRSQHRQVESTSTVWHFSYNLEH